MDNTEYYAILNDLVAQNQAVWQATIVETDGSTPAKAGMKVLVPAVGKACGNLGGGALEHTIIAGIRTELPAKPVFRTYLLSEKGDSAVSDTDLPLSMLCGGKVSVFIEPMFSTKRLYIVGAGHCGSALAHLARLCAYQVRLIDNRKEILTEIPPEICSDLHYSDFSDLEQHISFDTQARIVIMTHGHTHDRHVLESCLRKPCAYLGMIGSAQKVAATLESLRQKGFASQELDKVHAPIGLPIGSQSPYEIAVSIMAELIRFDSGKS